MLFSPGHGDSAHFVCLAYLTNLILIISWLAERSMNSNQCVRYERHTELFPGSGLKTTDLRRRRRVDSVIIDVTR